MKCLKIYLIEIIITLSSISCSQTIDIEDLGTDYLFVSLPESTDFKNLSEDEFIILSCIKDRFKITENENGLFELKAKSASEIAVSENIYNYFIEQIENTNNALIRIAGEKRNSIISRHEGGESIGQLDCVAYAVYGAGLVKSVEDAKEKIGLQLANSGIPSDDILRVLCLFGNFEEISVRSIKVEQFTTPVILVFKPDYSDYYYHAVNAYEFSADGWVTCRDYQDNSVESEYNEFKLPLGRFRNAFILRP